MSIKCTNAGTSMVGHQASLHRGTVHVTSASFFGRHVALSASICSHRSEFKVYTRWSSITRAHSTGSETTIAAEEGKPAFLDELRQYAMKLHTREQAPKEGQAKAPKNQKPFAPTKEGYLRFMEESKTVYDAFEDIIASNETYVCLRNTGLERGDALSKDVQYAIDNWGLHANPVTQEDSPGTLYASKLRELAESNPPAFICHYYNFYFAHTAGGRMIGKKVSEMALDGWMGQFYQWNGDVKQLLEGVRTKINAMAEEWSPEEKQACLEETPATFQYSGSLLKLISG
eukprot:jgi/Picsp_1/3258/NSC_06098-R1_heme oxygenase 1